MDPTPSPDTDPGDRRARLLRVARDGADATGFLPFDRWMDLVLYTEGAGYYTRPVSPLGPRGDFYTAAHVHPLFARAFAERIREVRTQLGPERPFTLVELGPGDYVTYPGDIPHVFDALEPDTTGVIVMEHV